MSLENCRGVFDPGSLGGIQILNTPDGNSKPLKEDRAFGSRGVRGAEQRGPR